MSTWRRLVRIHPLLGLIVSPILAHVPTASAQLGTAEIAERSLPATATVLTLDDRGDTLSQGSGFLVHADGIVATNWHVLRGATAIRVTVGRDPTPRRATILVRDSTTDLALLAIAATGVTALALDSSATLVGEKVIVIGNPLGLSGTVSEGIVSAARTDAGLELLQISAPLYPGASGGPVLNAYGRVVGVATSFVDGAEQLSFATPVRYVGRLLADAGRDSPSTIADVPRDAPEIEGDSLALVRQAAEGGDAQAQYALGVRYAAGAGVPQDFEEASAWYHAAALQGVARAQFHLGVMYAFGIGVDRDDEEAYRWVRRAAEQGDAEAQYNVGMFFATGTGVPESDRRALVWYQRAADQHFPPAEFSLGVMHRVGRGVMQSESQAAIWFAESAEHGHADAQQTLASMYAFGQGVPRDYVEAYKWFSLAAVSHGPHAEDQASAAAHMRDLLAARMDPDDLAEAKRLAEEWKPDPGRRQ